MHGAEGLRVEPVELRALGLRSESSAEAPAEELDRDILVVQEVADVGQGPLRLGSHA